MPARIDVLTKKVAEKKERRAAERSRANVSWEPEPLWLWVSFWAFASRDERSTRDGDINLDLLGWQGLIRSVAAAPTDEAALDVLLAWADTAFCGFGARCTEYQLTGPKYERPSSYDYLRDYVTQHRRRLGQSTKDVSWLPDDAVEAEGRALVLAELTADRASCEIRRIDPWERFFRRRGIIMTIARRPGEDWPEPPKNEDPLKAAWRESRQRQWDGVGARMFGNALAPKPDPNQPLIDAVNNLTSVLGAAKEYP